MATGPLLESPHFFKIILSNTLESGKLGILKKFFGRYGKDLLSLVLLKAPGNSTWSIRIEKGNNGTVWLWNGWREFMQHYSIVHVHLVVFKYKGNSTFREIIFNKSASEIGYSSSSISNLGSGFISPKSEDVVEVEESEDFIPHQKMTVEPHSPCSQLSPSCTSQDLEEGIGQPTCKASHSEQAFGGPTSTWPLPSPELASKFDSEYPFFKHILEIKEIATLKHSDRSWPVKLRSYQRGQKLSSGWIAFVRGTRLRTGNVCVFELIDRDDNVFKVHIFSRAGRNKQSKCRTIHSEPVFRDPTPSMPLITPEPVNLIRSIPSSNCTFLVNSPGNIFKEARKRELLGIQTGPGQ